MPLNKIMMHKKKPWSLLLKQCTLVKSRVSLTVRCRCLPFPTSVSSPYRWPSKWKGQHEKYGGHTCFCHCYSHSAHVGQQLGTFRGAAHMQISIVYVCAFNGVWNSLEIRRRIFSVHIPEIRQLRKNTQKWKWQVWNRLGKQRKIHGKKRHRPFMKGEIYKKVNITWCFPHPYFVKLKNPALVIEKIQLWGGYFGTSSLISLVSKF